MKANRRDGEGNMFAKIQLNFFVGLDTLYRGAVMAVDNKCIDLGLSPEEAAETLTRSSVEEEVRECLASYGWGWAEMDLSDYIGGQQGIDAMWDMVVPLVDELFPEFQPSQYGAGGTREVSAGAV